MLLHKHFILKGYFLLIALYSCEQANQKEPLEKNVQPALPALTETRPTEPTSYADTLFIRDEFATHPFSLDSISVPTVQHLLGAALINKKPVANKFSEQQVDTLVTLRKGRSYVQLYVVGTEENKCFYQSALIRDSLQVFSQPLQIGFTKEQVKQAFSPLAQEQDLPDIIQISNGTGTDLIYLVFSSNKLKTVQFQPYLE